MLRHCYTGLTLLSTVSKSHSETRKQTVSLSCVEVTNVEVLLYGSNTSIQDGCFYLPVFTVSTPQQTVSLSCVDVTNVEALLY